MERKAFEVIGMVENNIQFECPNLTKHWKEDRVIRHNKIMSVIGSGKLLASFEVYTAHPNGNEIHNIFDNGIVLIQNIHTRLVVTELIARAPQITRYWFNLGLRYPNIINGVLAKAREHQRKGYNLW